MQNLSNYHLNRGNINTFLDLLTDSHLIEKRLLKSLLKWKVTVILKHILLDQRFNNGIFLPLQEHIKCMSAQAEIMSNERPKHVYSKQYELMNAVLEGSDAEE